MSVDDANVYMKPYHSFTMPPFTASLGYIIVGHPFDVRSRTPANLAPDEFPDFVGGQVLATDVTSFQFLGTGGGSRFWPAA